MKAWTQWIPLLIPLVMLEIGLMVVALVDLFRREQTRWPKWAWVLVIVCINFVGPVIYLVFGREEE